MDNLNTKKLSMIAYSLGFLVAVVIVYILLVFKDLAVPFTIAIFLTFLFHPLLLIMKNKYKIPKSIGLVLIFLLNFAIFYLLGLIIFANLSGFSGKIEEYGDKLSVVVQSILSPFQLTLDELAKLFGFEIEKFNAGSLIKRLLDAGIIQGVISSFSNLFSKFFVVMLFWVFMIMGKENFEERLKVAFKSRGDEIHQAIGLINSQLQAYLVIKTIISLITGLVFTIILSFYGIPFAIIWGLLAFILNFIPNIGSLLATVFPIIIGLLEYGLGFTSISLAVVLVGAQNIFGNLIEPKFMGSKMDLSAVFILISLIFWGWLWGIVGMFLAVPIASVIKIFCSAVEPLKPIAVLIGSKAEPVD